MKKLFLIPLMLLASLMMATACSEDEPAADGHEQTTPGEDGDEGGNVDGTNGRYLVLYCSRTGNTESMAQTIQSTLDCDMIEVVPETPYDDNYNTMLKRARTELAAIGQGTYPAIATSIESFEDYDIVFVGYPVWHGHMATPMQSFLHSHADLLAGKRIALFASSVSSLISTSERDAASLVPDATFEESMLLTSSTLDDMGSRIPAWLEALGATRDFLSRLPLEVTLEDYNNGTEKIFYPDPELSLDDTPRGCTPVPGDITIYEPWGNVAIFCRDWTQSNSLIKIGHIDDNGIETFNVPGDITVRFERR